MKTKRTAALILSIFLMSGILSGCAPEYIPPSIPEPVVKEITIRCVGDVMGHMSQINAAYDKDSGKYDFSDNYFYVKEYIEGADVALCNVETTFKGDGKYTGYPAFNSPDELARDLKGAGFDVAITANNHMLDTGMKGLARTLEVLRGAGLATSGSMPEGEDAKSCIVEADGIKVSVLSYTYETPLVAGRRTLNGAYMPKGAEDYISSFRSYALDEDIAAIGRDIDKAKGESDIVVVYFHWGEEYKRKPSAVQRQLAEAVAEAGADIIFASHPHVLQGIEEIEVEREVVRLRPDLVEMPEPPGYFERLKGYEPPPITIPTETVTTSYKVPVFYSMGNFISNQREETLQNRYTEQGMIASVDLRYIVDTGEVTVESVQFIPTWVEKYSSGGRVRYAIIPLVEGFEENPELVSSGHAKRAAQALADACELIGEDYLY